MFKFLKQKKELEVLRDRCSNLEDMYNELLSEHKETKRQLEESKEVAHIDDSDQSKVIFEITTDENEDIEVAPRSELNAADIQGFISSGYIDFDNTEDKLAMHLAMILCVSDACHNIIHQFDGDEQ